MGSYPILKHEHFCAAPNAPFRPEMWNRLADLLAQRVGAPFIAVMEHDFSTDQGLIRRWIGFPPPALEQYSASFASRNVWLRADHRYRPGETLTGAEIVPNWELVRSEFYKGWLRPLHLFHCLLGVLRLTARQIQCLVALRPLEASPFAADDKRSFADFLPLLQCAADVEGELACLQRQADVLSDVIACLPDAVMIIDHEYRLLLINQAAEALIARERSLTVRNGVLVGADCPETAALRRLIARATDARGESLSGGGGVTIRHGAEEPPTIVTVIPLQHAIVGYGDAPRRVAAVFTRNPVGPTSARGLCDLYQLTPAEARLTSLLANGHSLTSAARELCITKNTARTHMKRIYAKTEIHRQADLVRLLSAWSEQAT